MKKYLLSTIGMACMALTVYAQEETTPTASANDYLKANKKKINLIQDQLIHLAQVVATWVALVVSN